MAPHGSITAPVRVPVVKSAATSSRKKPVLVAASGGGASIGGASASGGPSVPASGVSSALAHAATNEAAQSALNPLNRGQDSTAKAAGTRDFTHTSTKRGSLHDVPDEADRPRRDEQTVEE